MTKNKLKEITTALLITMTAGLNSCAVKVGNPDDGGEESNKYNKENVISEQNYSERENIIETPESTWTLSCTQAKFSSATLSKFGCGLVNNDGENISLTQIDDELNLVLLSEKEDKVDAVITKDEEDIYFPFKVELTANSSDDILEYLDSMVVTIKSGE